MALWVTEQSQCQENRRIYDPYPTGYSEIVPQFNACIVVFILYSQGLMATSLYTRAKRKVVSSVALTKTSNPPES